MDTMKGPNIFYGYLNSAAENKKTFTADGFFKTRGLASPNVLSSSPGCRVPMLAR
jgi:non-ribosomal peptide synthetase component E (peptide arylation enzyme)